MVGQSLSYICLISLVHLLCVLNFHILVKPSSNRALLEDPPLVDFFLLTMVLQSLYKAYWLWAFCMSQTMLQEYAGVWSPYFSASTKNAWHVITKDLLYIFPNWLTVGFITWFSFLVLSFFFYCYKSHEGQFGMLYFAYCWTATI